MVALSRFNEKGILEFEIRIQELRESSAWIPFDDILNNPSLVESFTGIDIEIPATFSDRYECGKFFYNLFLKYKSELKRFSSEPEQDIGLWGWLSANMAPWLASVDSGKMVIGEKSRWVFMPHNYDRFYRHLLAGPFLIFHGLGEDVDLARILLYNSVLKPNTAYVEQIASRPEFMQNRAALSLIDDLYFDHEKNQPKKINTPGGDIRRLGVVYNQLARTWDLADMDVSQIRTVLPREFSQTI